MAYPIALIGLTVVLVCGALPVIGLQGHGLPVDPNALPWRAVGKLQATSESLRVSCTGTLVAPAVVLTAAHCLYNPRTQRFFAPSDLHFLIGYDHGVFVGHAIGTRVIIDASFEATRPTLSPGSDWALVTLDRALGLPDRILAIGDHMPEPGMSVSLGGFRQDRAYVITADTACRVTDSVSDRDGRRVLRHDCAATHGDSGAPLLVLEAGQWFVAGVEVAEAKDESGGIAAAAIHARERLGINSSEGAMPFKYWTAPP